MAGTQVQHAVPSERPSAIAIPATSMNLPIDSVTARLRNRLVLDTFSPVNQNGSFEFDRVIKAGYVQKRTQKTKAWKPVYLVLRGDAISVYKTEKEEKLRHKLYLSDLTAVTLLKDPKHKRQNVFGLFSPSKNFHFQAGSASDAQEWVALVRAHARIEEEEEEMFLASPVIRRQSYIGANASAVGPTERERLASSSPEPLEPPIPHFMPSTVRRPSNTLDSSGLSGTELASHSDFSDNDMQRAQGASIESYAVQSATAGRTGTGNRSATNLNSVSLETDPDRVVWQGWLWFLRSKGGVKQWKDYWAVLRPRNLILYKDASEYTAQFIVPLSSIVNVVDLDPMSRTKTHCMQVITDEKSYRFCAHDEESLVQCLGAFKSLLAKRRELELRAAAASGTPGS